MIDSLGVKTRTAAPSVQDACVSRQLVHIRCFYLAVDDISSNETKSTKKNVFILYVDVLLLWVAIKIE